MRRLGHRPRPHLVGLARSTRACRQTQKVTPDAVKHLTNAVTVQWSLISESLNHSIHEKGEHGYGSLLQGSHGARIQLPPQPVGPPRGADAAHRQLRQGQRRSRGDHLGFPQQRLLQQWGLTPRPTSTTGSRA
ncbi:hypothetical protein ACRAWD_29595 [Caulobacter segnis]